MFARCPMSGEHVFAVLWVVLSLYLFFVQYPADYELYLKQNSLPFEICDFRKSGPFSHRTDLHGNSVAWSVNASVTISNTSITMLSIYPSPPLKTDFGARTELLRVIGNIIDCRVDSELHQVYTSDVSSGQMEVMWWQSRLSLVLSVCFLVYLIHESLKKKRQ